MSYNPQIYVADLAAYNAGDLHGVWIDATLALEEIEGKVQAMLADSKEEVAEEWRIDDYENFQGATISEYASLALVRDIALFIKEHGALGGGLLALCDDNLSAAKETLKDRYLGEWGSLAEYAEETTTAITRIPERLVGYIDYDAIARDMILNVQIISVEVEDKVHVFATRYQTGVS